MINIPQKSGAELVHDFHAAYQDDETLQKLEQAYEDCDQDYPVAVSIETAIEQRRAELREQVRQYADQPSATSLESSESGEGPRNQ